MKPAITTIPAVTYIIVDESVSVVLDVAINVADEVVEVDVVMFPGLSGTCSGVSTAFTCLCSPRATTMFVVHDSYPSFSTVIVALNGDPTKCSIGDLPINFPSTYTSASDGVDVMVDWHSFAYMGELNKLIIANNVIGVTKIVPSVLRFIGNMMVMYVLRI